ncbi:MAG: nucleotidyltransferase domain-containing protein [Cytophagaceae bacterium]|jgi:hypothetical protein|nr:nucleotidyltransferase domain-containing protein [Cytophagaceae bacterium]
MTNNHTSTPVQNSLREQEKKCITLLCYFNLFKHPLHLKDLERLCAIPDSQLLPLLKPFLIHGLLFEYQGYYSPDPTIQVLVQERMEAEQRAHQFWQQLPSTVKRIARFPFVRGIAVSGSLSKGVIKEDGDIDFFILTERKRLWTCRSLLILYKKIFLLNSRKFFCLNYFVDLNHLEIRDKNIFTAIEVSHLLPVYDAAHYFSDFHSSNRWAQTHATSPAPIALPVTVKVPEKLFWKGLVEKILATHAGSLIEKWFHVRTLTRWKQKFNHFDSEKFERTMRSTEGISKHHPNDFQQQVLKQLDLHIHNLWERYILIREHENTHHT